MPKRFLFFSLLALLVVAGIYFYLTRLADYKSAEAVLLVRSGAATVVRAGGNQQVEAGKQLVVVSKDLIQMNGAGVLAFERTQVDLMPDTQLEVTHYGAAENNAQIDLLQKTGRTRTHIQAFTDQRSYFHLRSSASAISAKDGEFVVYIGNNDL